MDFFDYSLICLTMAGLLLNLLATLIVLKHVYILKSSRFYFKCLVTSDILALLFGSLSYFVHKYSADLLNCFIVDYFTNSFISWAIATPVIMIFNFYLEIKSEEGFYNKRKHFYKILSALVLLAILALNSPYLIIGLANKQSNETQMMLKTEHKILDCASFTNRQLIYLDILKLLTQLIIPFICKFTSILLIFCRLIKDKHFLNRKFLRRSFHFLTQLTLLSIGQLCLISLISSIKIYKHFYASAFQHASNDWKGIVLYYMDSATYHCYMIVFMSPFIFHMVLNTKFRMHLKRLAKLDKIKSLVTQTTVEITRRKKIALLRRVIN